MQQCRSRIESIVEALRAARWSRNNGDTRYHRGHLSGVISRTCNHFVVPSGSICGRRNFFCHCVALIAATSSNRTGRRLDSCGSRNKGRRCWQCSRENRRSMPHSRETSRDTPASRPPPLPRSTPPGHHASLLWAAIITAAASRNEQLLINGTPARLWIAMVRPHWTSCPVCWRSLERGWMYAGWTRRAPIATPMTIIDRTGGLRPRPNRNDRLDRLLENRI